MHNCSKWISRETSALQDSPEFSAGLVFSNDFSHFKLLLKPFSCLVLICLWSAAVEPTFLKTDLRQLSRTCLSDKYSTSSVGHYVPKLVIKCDLFITLAFPHPATTESVAVLFKNNQKVEHCQTFHSGYPYFPECQVGISTWSAIPFFELTK